MSDPDRLSLAANETLRAIQEMLRTERSSGESCRGSMMLARIHLRAALDELDQELAERAEVLL